MPCLDAENQISRPSGDQARFPMSSHPADSVVIFPDRSTTATSPRLSVRTGCSAKAMRSPDGETRMPLIHPAGS